jgi:hypothetical protein
VPPDRRTLRDIRSAYAGMKRYQEETGEWVQWFRFNVNATTSDPTYATAPQRAWYSPVTVPVLLGEYQRASKNFDDDGMYLVDRMHGILSYDQFFGSQILDPDPYGMNHLNDRIGFDGRLFGLTSFMPRGRVASYFLTISIDMVQLTAEDLASDAAIPMFSQYVIAS